MQKIPIDTIIQKIKEQTGLSEKEINTKIKDKLDLLSGLISEEGAAHILANELGVKVLEEPQNLQVKSIIPGMKSVSLSAKVIRKYELREFEREGRKGKVASFLAGDSTGIIRVTAWNDKADLLTNINENDSIKIENAYTKDNNGRTELHLGDKAQLTILENAPDIEVKSRDEPQRKKIADLKENEDNVSILGTIVQVFDPKFFETCPECNKRMKANGSLFACDTHGTKEPSYGYVVNLFLDDGSENVRVVLWRNQMQKLFSMGDDEITSKKGTLGFEDVKNDLLGKIVKFVGRTNKNQMFDRVEFVPNLVFMNPDPSEEIERLSKELEAAKAEQKGEDEETPAKLPEHQEEKLPAAGKSDDLDIEDIEEIEDLESL